MGPAGPAASPRATAAAGVAVLMNSCTNLKQGISRGCGLSGYLVAKKKKKPLLSLCRVRHGVRTTKEAEPRDLMLS